MVLNFDLLPLAALVGTASVLVIATLGLFWRLHGFLRTQSIVGLHARVLNAIEQAIVVTHPDGTILFMNRHAEHVYGWPAAEAVGQAVANVIPSWIPAEHMQSMMASLRAGKCWSGEFPIQRYDGTESFAYHIAAPILNANGELTQIINTSTDITQHRQTQEALRESEAVFRALFDASLDIACIINAQGTLLSVNPRGAQLLKRPAHELLDQRLRDLIDPDAVNPHLERIKNVFVTGEPARFENRMYNQWFDNLIHPLKHEHDTIDKAIIVSRDITERRQAEERFAKLNACFLSFTTDPNHNIQQITALAGELMSATCALYNRLDGDLLVSQGTWNTPPRLQPGGQTRRSHLF
ncbi:MAG: PAS domain-containing protein [Anaerolineae bacterium]|nr:PAS domain-containing protein [Anaerolineae bacterium]